MGIPAAKIIAKYGKKAYNAAKKLYKNTHPDTKSLIKSVPPSALITAGVSPLVIHTIDKNLKKAEKKKERTESRKRQRGIKTYAKGGGIRKPKY